MYPELVSARDKIHTVIAEEEASFSRTLVKGIERFKKLAAAAQVRASVTRCFHVLSHTVPVTLCLIIPTVL